MCFSPIISLTLFLMAFQPRLISSLTCIYNMEVQFVRSFELEINVFITKDKWNG